MLPARSTNRAATAVRVSVPAHRSSLTPHSPRGICDLRCKHLFGCHKLVVPPGADKGQISAPPNVAAYARRLIFEPRKDAPAQLLPFLREQPLSVPAFFRDILTKPDLARLTDPSGRRAIDVAVPACKQRMQAALS